MSNDARNSILHNLIITYAESDKTIKIAEKEIKTYMHIWDNNTAKIVDIDPAFSYVQRFKKGLDD